MEQTEKQNTTKEESKRHSAVIELFEESQMSACIP